MRIFRRRETREGRDIRYLMEIYDNLEVLAHRIEDLEAQLREARNDIRGLKQKVK